MNGKINSFLSMSALDGEGIRCVVFMQGCPLRCVYCHNPEMHGLGGETVSAAELLQRVLKYKNYFGENGGVTLSGGEPFLQSEFAAEFFSLCKQNGINTAVQTSGAIIDKCVMDALGNTDLCMLDVKFTSEDDYLKYANGSLSQTLEFLGLLNNLKVRTWVRQVIVPKINDTSEQVAELKKLCAPYSCVEKIVLLPFRKICMEKYEALGLSFPLADTPETDPDAIRKLEKVLRGNH